MTDKVVEDVEDSPVVAVEETETAAPVEDAPAAPETTTTEEKAAVPVVEVTAEKEKTAAVTENGKADAAAEVVAPVVEEAGKFFTRSMTPSCAIYSRTFFLSFQKNP